MSLIKCHECGADISSNASRCPKCGSRTITSTKRRNRTWIIIASIIVIIAASIAIYSYYEHQQRLKVLEKQNEQFFNSHPIRLY